MTDPPVLLRQALPRAEELLRELRAISNGLGSAAGAAPMDAVDGLTALVRRMRFILSQTEGADGAGDDVAAVDRGIQLCFCPPMADRADPEQHQGGCLEAEARRIRAFWAENPPNVELCWALWGPGRRPSLSAIPPGCYEASFGRVHVRPGCRCPG